MFDFVSAAYAMGAPATDGSQPNPIASLLPFALMFLVLYVRSSLSDTSILARV